MKIIDVSKGAAKAGSQRLIHIIVEIKKPWWKRLFSKAKTLTVEVFAPFCEGMDEVGWHKMCYYPSGLRVPIGAAMRIDNLYRYWSSKEDGKQKISM